MEEPLEKQSLARQIYRREYSIKIDLTEKGCEDVRWLNKAQERVEWQAFVVVVLNFFWSLLLDS
jgi:hypothetical protein